MTASAVLQTSIRRVVRAGGKAGTEQQPQATSEVHPVYLLYWYTRTNADSGETLQGLRMAVDTEEQLQAQEQEEEEQWPNVTPQHESSKEDKEMDKARG
jgi:hypothetical protein